MTQTGLHAHPVIIWKWFIWKRRKRGAKRKENAPNSKAQPKAQDTNVVPVTDVTEGVTSVTQHSLVTGVTEGVTSVTQHTPVTGVTHGVTNVTPFPYFVGAGNASETWRSVEECWALHPLYPCARWRLFGQHAWPNDTNINSHLENLKGGLFHIPFSVAVFAFAHLLFQQLRHCVLQDYCLTYPG